MDLSQGSATLTVDLYSDVPEQQFPLWAYTLSCANVDSPSPPMPVRDGDTVQLSALGPYLVTVSTVVPLSP